MKDRESIEFIVFIILVFSVNIGIVILLSHYMECFYKYGYYPCEINAISINPIDLIFYALFLLLVEICLALALSIFLSRYEKRLREEGGNEG